MRATRYAVSRIALSLLLVLSSTFLLACGRSGERTRTWQAADHDQPEAAEPIPSQVRNELRAEPSEDLGDGPQRTSPHASEGAAIGSAMRIWATRCMGCHGQIGAGNGAQAPQGMNLDLSALAWQRSVTDAQIAQSILQGKGAMPAFAVEPEALEALVSIIRRMGGVNPHPQTPPTSTVDADNASPRAPNPNP